MSDSRDCIEKDLFVPEPDKEADLAVLPYCCEAVVFALKKLYWWENRAFSLNLDCYERLAGLWKEASSTLGRLAGLFGGIRLSHMVTFADDAPTLDAAITAADSTLEILHRFCETAAQMTLALAKAGPGRCNVDMVDDCSRLTERDLAELVKITIRLRTLRSELPDQDEQDAVEEVAAA